MSVPPSFTASYRIGTQLLAMTMQPVVTFSPRLGFSLNADTLPRVTSATTTGNSAPKMPAPTPSRTCRRNAATEIAELFQLDQVVQDDGRVRAGLRAGARAVEWLTLGKHAATAERRGDARCRLDAS